MMTAHHIMPKAHAIMTNAHHIMPNAHAMIMNLHHIFEGVHHITIKSGFITIYAHNEFSFAIIRQSRGPYQIFVAYCFMYVCNCQFQ